MHRQASPETEPASVAVETASEALKTPPSAAIGADSQLSRLNFPSKLHRILSSPEYNDIICWLPHGRSWRVMQQKRFEKEVLPLFFRHGRYASFARQINGWGFRRIASGPDFNSYYHELFLRDDPSLCVQMTRPSAEELADRKKDEPDSPPNFYLVPSIRAEQKATGDPDLKPPAEDHASSSAMDDSEQSATMQANYMANLIQRISMATPELQNRILELELSILRNQRQAVLDKLELLRASRTASDGSNTALALGANRVSIPSAPAPPLHHRLPQASIGLAASTALSQPMRSSLVQQAALELYLQSQIPYPQPGLTATSTTGGVPSDASTDKSF